jgi:hypothetical protein
VALVDQQVLWLEIAMQDAMSVAIEQAGVHLVCEFLRTDG